MQEQQSPTSFWRRRKEAVLIGIAFAVLFITAVAGLVLVQPDEPEHATTPHDDTPSVTMYYRDGKTVLWESDAAGWMNSLPDGPARVVGDELRDKYSSAPFKRGDWKVVTTFDASLQTAAVQQLEANQSQLDKQRADHALLVAQDVTNGQIVSWAGETANAKTEVATLALPFTYAAVMEQDASFTASTRVADSQEQLPGYACTNRSLPTKGGNCLHNFDYQFKGSVTVSEALAGLRLVSAVKASQPLLGTDGSSTKLQKYAEKLANGDKLQSYTDKLAGERKFACYLDESLDESAESTCYAAATFGAGLYATPLDMITAYSALANQGKKLPATSILRLRQDKAAVYDWRAKPGEQAMKESVSRDITGILTNAQASYLSRKDIFSVHGRPVGVMTGVEQQGTMASTVHFTSQYAVGVWAMASNGLSGAGETLVVPPANGWLQAAHK